DAERSEQMSLAGTAVADEHDRLGALYVAALGQFTEPGRRDRRRLAEVELVQGLDPRQVGLLDASFDGPPLAILQLGREECLQIAQVWLALAFGLLGQRPALAGDRG